MQVVWVPERKGSYPLKDIAQPFPRLEYIERKMGIYTFEEYRNRGFAYALCLRTIQELEKMGIKAIWACDKKNIESDRLAQRLGYVNPVEYEFIYFPAQN